MKNELAELTKQDINVITEAEKQLTDDHKEKVALVAYTAK